MRKIILLSMIALCAPIINGCTEMKKEMKAANVSVDSISNITTEQANAIIAERPEIAILDIRTPDEYNGGHVRNSTNIDYYSPEFVQSLKRLPRDEAYVVYCRSGNRSGKAMSVFKELGFREVYNVSGGMNVWTGTGLPK